VSASPQAPHEVAPLAPHEACLLEVVNNGTLDDVRGLKGFGPKRASAILNTERSTVLS
jgi:hypothetical protein